MLALQLLKPSRASESPLQLVELADPEPAADEIVLEVAACAVCRTDLQLAEGDLDARRLPIVPGHQAVGRVEKLGRDVTGWQVGERAGVAWLASTDGNCAYCQSGRENLCVLPNSRGGIATAGMRPESQSAPISSSASLTASMTSRLRHCCAAASSAIGR
jgi:propanol-preferring alcohol dehydrogenase